MCIVIVENIGGKPVTTMNDMMYWLKWGNREFDIRDIWNVLDLDKEEYFENLDALNHRDYRRNDNFYDTFIEAAKNKDLTEILEKYSYNIAN